RRAVLIHLRAHRVADLLHVRRDGPHLRSKLFHQRMRLLEHRRHLALRPLGHLLQLAKELQPHQPRNANAQKSQDHRDRDDAHKNHHQVDVMLHRPRILLQESQRQAANCVHLFTPSDLIVSLQSSRRNRHRTSSAKQKGRSRRTGPSRPCRRTFTPAASPRSLTCRPACPHPPPRSPRPSASGPGPCPCPHTATTECGPCRSIPCPCRHTGPAHRDPAAHTGRLAPCPGCRARWPCRGPPSRSASGRHASPCPTSAHTARPQGPQSRDPPETIQTHLRCCRYPPSSSPDPSLCH